jgi:hypothetical protein
VRCESLVQAKVSFQYSNMVLVLEEYRPSFCSLDAHVVGKVVSVGENTAAETNALAALDFDPRLRGRLELHPNSIPSTTT